MNRRQFTTTLVAAAGLPVWARAAAVNREPVRLDADGTLRLAGRREFILGTYQPPNGPDGLRAAREAGFNLVNRPATRAAWDEAHAAGLRVWSALGSLPEKGRTEAEARLRETVTTLRDHPALLFWETEDEPTFVWKEPTRIRTSAAQINATAAVIRQLDPAHPLYLNQSPTNLVPTLQAYNPAADLVATDIYPVIPQGIRESYALWPDGRQGDFADNTLGQVGRYADKMRQVAGPGRAVFMVLQAFAWEMLREKDRNPAHVLYPTEAELRFMAWQAVVHGVNGLIWWGLSYTPADAPLWPRLRTVVKELASERDALAARPVRVPLTLRYHDTGHSLDRGLEWQARPCGPGGRELLVIAVNADPNPVHATLGGLRAASVWEPRLGGTGATLKGSSVTETFEPFGTRVWHVRR